MKTIEKMLADAILKSIDSNEGTFCVDAEDNENLIEVEGHYKVKGYIDDKFYHSMDIWVTTEASVTIDKVRAYDKNENEVEVECDIKAIEEYVEIEEQEAGLINAIEEERDEENNL